MAISSCAKSVTWQKALEIFETIPEAPVEWGVFGGLGLLVLEGGWGLNEVFRGFS